MATLMTAVQASLEPDQAMGDMASILALPALLEAPAAEDLSRQFADRLLAGLPLTIDGQHVNRIATQCVQVLVVAARTARSRELLFRLQTPSAALTDALVRLGLQHELSL
jgi:anti-anti-sigma regulatory factor